MNDSKTIFPINIIKTVRDDRKRTFSALNRHGTIGFCSDHVKFTREMASSGRHFSYNYAHQKGTDLT